MTLLRSHSCRPLRKSLRPERPRRSRASRPLRVCKIKFLSGEELYGVGGPVFDANGNRVANELGGQNCVTGEMWKNKPPFSLTLNNAVSDDTAWQCKH